MGWIGGYSTVDARRLSELTSDPNVFLVDVTPAWIRRELAAAGAISEADVAKVPVYVDLPFAYMEGLGMVVIPTVPVPVSTVVVPTIPPAP